jgi:hypothetical protein
MSGRKLQTIRKSITTPIIAASIRAVVLLFLNEVDLLWN